ncbi:DUF2147 domain-containing protein [Flavobacterium sp. CYK-55]|uniref:DUF2147 domain-containing protein n=1 Tax=Flavobacterium sp. CYK-55 TaxID=2835529 RepID=UPI001BD1A493|nr:DUF2147 domain-containing protein [Flavobacterium sp. CYK-55]MBS7786710.1 DUF2147 domain-containing protein [Flavobacterium sp. CYK-55]
MKKGLIIAFLFLSALLSAQHHSVLGRWKTIDDQTGKAVSIIEIYEKQNKIYGKVIEIFNPKVKVPRCEQCQGEDKNKPILGLVVIKGLVKDKDEYTHGKILDPKHGKLYKCSISLESRDRLKVRGFIGINLLGRTQIWERIK